ncbi:MAG: hypothetical protein KAS15_06970, partial [Nanoarchaeota archaeon]|nr:hypothetical protein [Nanoarchaeota archaeon]
FPGSFQVGSYIFAGPLTIQGALDMNSNRITNLAAPVDDNDAATKAYVDAAGGALAPPTGLVKKINGLAYKGEFLPTPDNDGSYIVLPAGSTGTLYRYNTAGGIVWSVVRTDIGANVDSWTGVFWLDTDDSAIWVWAYDYTTAPDTYYLAKIALADGTVTNIGTCQPGDSRFGNSRTSYYSERASMGFGDLTIRDGDYKIVLNTTDGSIVSAVAQVTQNGAAISPGSNYETADGAIYISSFATGNAANDPYAIITRGGSTRLIMLDASSPRITSSWTTPWDGYVAMSSSSSGNVYGPRFYSRTDFDDWLKRLADNLGLPE